jgi:cation transport regulator ChaC
VDVRPARHRIVWAQPEQWKRLQPVFASCREPGRVWSVDGSTAPPTTDSYLCSPADSPRSSTSGRWPPRSSSIRLGTRADRDPDPQLNEQLKAGLAAIPGITMHTPRDSGSSAGIVCFEVAGHSPEQVVEYLHERRIVASTSPYKVTYARLSASLVNDSDQVEAALARRAITGPHVTRPAATLLPKLARLHLLRARQVCRQASHGTAGRQVPACMLRNPMIAPAHSPSSRSPGSC